MPGRIPCCGPEWIERGWRCYACGAGTSQDLGLRKSPISVPAGADSTSEEEGSSSTHPDINLSLPRGAIKTSCGPPDTPLAQGLPTPPWPIRPKAIGGWKPLTILAD